ncbi:SMI1/KNR4 family protein [Yoonia sp. 2307UL14-13]|uniref:SMI1/KNR4 family protein n=1 Tax=Yoonia sp. 2307UL14-13 TaxID=3126506 RepID=UPI00309C848A
MTIYLKHMPNSAGDPWPAAPQPDTIAGWEAANITLPEAYRAFMLRYNGGAIYPLEFEITINEDAADMLDIPAESGVDILFDWNTFQQTNTQTQPWRDYMIAIGYDTTSSIIGLGSDGRVLYWWRNLANEWEVEDDGPYPVGVLGNDFQGFIEDLSGDTAPRWNLPGDLDNAMKIEF